MSKKKRYLVKLSDNHTDHVQIRYPQLGNRDYAKGVIREMAKNMYPDAFIVSKDGTFYTLVFGEVKPIPMVMTIWIEEFTPIMGSAGLPNAVDFTCYKCGSLVKRSEGES